MEHSTEITFKLLSNVTDCYSSYRPIFKLQTAIQVTDRYSSYQPIFKLPSRLPTITVTTYRFQHHISNNRYASLLLIILTSFFSIGISQPHLPTAFQSSTTPGKISL